LVGVLARLAQSLFHRKIRKKLNFAFVREGYGYLDRRSIRYEKWHRERISPRL